ncbi:MAG: SMP-30/gluconolactonase/LRE family protein [Planctomycetota bacterium]
MDACVVRPGAVRSLSVAIFAFAVAMSGCTARPGGGSGALEPAKVTAAGGLRVPESILYDPAADVYLVSCVNGSPFGEDGKGFVSRVRPDGGVEKLKWIEGGARGVVLDAPKGMALAGDVLYVADVTVVRKFDRTSGKPLAEIAIPGAAFLNDVAAGPDGTVYVSDSGFSRDFSPTDAGAVYAIAPDGSVKALLKGGGLSAPNGILAESDGVLLVTWTDGKLQRLAKDGTLSDVAKLPAAKLDGLVREKGGSLLVSSWEGSCVYRVGPAGEVSVALGDLASPADIGYDEKRGRVLVPLFNEDQIVCQRLE